MIRFLTRLLLAWVLFAFNATSAQASLLAQITGLTDVNLPTWSVGDGAVHGSVDVCIYAVGVLNGNYSLTASSPGGFVLKNGSRSIPYSVVWNSGGSGNLGNTGATLTNNVPANSSNASILSPLCGLGIGATARLNINITQADMDSALAGTYTGTLTLTVAAI